MLDRDTVLAKVRTALQSVLDDARLDVRPEQHLVDDLGFDSPKVASLTIALEDEFDEVLLLHDWIAAADGPSELTVGSLVDYLTELLADLPADGA
jgi:acyl carrier protein